MRFRGFCFWDFALRSEVLCPRRQSTQSAAGGSSRACPMRYPATPRPPVTRGTHDKKHFAKLDRRGIKHGLISACHPLPLHIRKIGQVVFLSQMRLVQAVFRFPPVQTAPRNYTPRRNGIESGIHLILQNTQRQRSRGERTFRFLPAPTKSAQISIKGPS